MTPPIPDITEMNREYWEGAAAGELRIRHCNQCAARFRFAYLRCPECWSPDIGWRRVSGKGTVTNFSVVHQAPYPAFHDMVPYVLALVQLDEGVRMITNVVECDPVSVRVGMRVNVTFEQRGPVALPVFKPE